MAAEPRASSSSVNRLAAGAKLVAAPVRGRPFITIAPFSVPWYFPKSAGDDTSTSTGVPETRPFVLGLHASGCAITWRYTGCIISTLKRRACQPGPGKPPGSNVTFASPQSLSRCLAQSAAAAYAGDPRNRPP